MNENYQRSAVNRTRYGEQLDHVLPCRRDSCAMLDTCRLAGNPDRRPEYGQSCPVEEAYIAAYVLSFRRNYAPALGLGDDAAEQLATRLAMLELRRERLSLRLRATDSIVNVDGSRPSAFYSEVELVNRYSACIDNEMRDVVSEWLS